MRYFLLTMMLALGLGASVLVPRAQADEAAIKGVISAQIEAFKADDFEAAFAFASPKIKGIFGDADNFGLMVRQGYPMVWRPSSVTFGENKAYGGTVWQNVLVRDAAGKLFLFQYEMIKAGDSWQIDSVSPLKTPELSA